MAEASTDGVSLAIAERAATEARAILATGGMRLYEAYRDIWITGSEVPLSRYEVYKRAHGQTAVRVGLNDQDYVWWYRDAYYVARPDLLRDAIERFAHMEENEERRHLERFRAGVAAMSSNGNKRRHTAAKAEMLHRAATADSRWVTVSGLSTR